MVMIKADVDITCPNTLGVVVQGAELSGDMREFLQTVGAITHYDPATNTERVKFNLKHPVTRWVCSEYMTQFVRSSFEQYAGKVNDK